MALADDRQRIMPMPDDRLPPRGQPLAYPEAVLLVDPINPDLRGEVRWPDRDKDDTCWLSMVSI
jgi:rhamnogalacturonan endolyase